MERYILVFETPEKRDEWLAQQLDFTRIYRKYKSSPRVATELTEQEARELKKSGVTVITDEDTPVQSRISA